MSEPKDKQTPVTPDLEPKKDAVGGKGHGGGKIKSFIATESQ